MDLETGEKILRESFPDLQIRTIQAIEEGWDSLVLDINGEMIAKFPRYAWSADKLQKESRLLPVVRHAVDLPVPNERALVNEADGAAIVQVYEKLPGEMLTPELEMRLPADRLSVQLGRFLTQLHSIEPAVLESLGLDPVDPQIWFDRWLRLGSRIEEDVLPLLDVETGAAAREFLAGGIDASLAEFRPVLIHGDLGGWNILVDDETSTVTGIIDWGDAELGDPAYDFTALKAEYSDALYREIARSYEPQPDDAFLSRVDVYARLYPLYSALWAGQIGRTVMEQKYLEMTRGVFGVER